MSKKINYYLVCKKGIFGGLSPIKIFTALSTAKDFAITDKKYVVLKQVGNDDLMLITHEDNK